MAKSGTVWMVHARTPMAGVKGDLHLEDRVLLFVPLGGRSAETALPLDAITSVHRVRGSPVLEVAVELPNAPTLIGFYFVEPPPLARAGTGAKILDRFMVKRRAVIRLKVGGTAKREEVDGWVAAIRNGKGEEDG